MLFTPADIFSLLLLLLHDVQYIHLPLYKIILAFFIMVFLYLCSLLLAQVFNNIFNLYLLVYIS